jgi:NADPH:quinone reductase-like Zn-dependent oxidoreductase
MDVWRKETIRSRSRWWCWNSFVQLAAFGAGKIIATASSAEKLELARQMGADVLVNYTESNWVEQVLEATEEKEDVARRHMHD